MLQAVLKQPGIVKRLVRLPKTSVRDYHRFYQVAYMRSKSGTFCFVWTGSQGLLNPFSSEDMDARHIDQWRHAKLGGPQSSVEPYQHHFPGICSNHQKLWLMLARMPPPGLLRVPCHAFGLLPLPSLSRWRSDTAELHRRGRTTRLSDALWEFLIYAFVLLSES
jgi:hypothetical protein